VGGERKRWPAGIGQPRWLSIAGGEEHSGEHGKGATVHGKRIPWHREEAEERGSWLGQKDGRRVLPWWRLPWTVARDPRRKRLKL